MDEAFLQSFFAGKHRVIGREMRPLSLAHRVALMAVDSPFLKDADEPFTFNELSIAAKICASSNPFSVSIKATFLDRVRYWMHKRFPRYFVYEAAKFLTYLGDYIAPPNIIEGDDDPREQDGLDSGVPWMLNIVAVLMRSGGMNFRDAWSLPEGQAIWYFAALARLEGAKLRITSKELEDEVLAALKKIKDENSELFP